MQFSVSRIDSGLNQQEKYKNIPRDRWEKWREKLHNNACAAAKELTDSKSDAPQNAYNCRVSAPPASTFLIASDDYAETLFHAISLTHR